MEDNATKCLLCSHPAKLRHKEYPGYQESSTFKIYHCQSCNTAFSLPRVDATSIYENIYKIGNQMPGYERYWEYAQIVKKITNPLEYLAEAEECYWGVKETLSFFKQDKQSIKILEIGSGLGYLTYSLIAAGYNAIGLDISQTAVMLANRTFGNHFICDDLFDYSKHNSGSFDFVILTETIEHLNNPLSFIEQTLKLLKTGGSAIISTPNKSLYPDKFIWATDLPPVHCCWFSEESMAYIANRVDANIKLLNFSNYYKKHSHHISSNNQNGTQLPHPIIDKDGELLIRSGKKNSYLKSYWRLLIITKFQYIQKSYRKLKEFKKKIHKSYNEDAIICGERGTVLCAVLQKNK